MRIRHRLAILATAVSGLLAAGLLLSAPAFAWDSQLTDVSTSCPPGSEKPRVELTMKFDTARSGHVQAAFKIGDDVQKVDEELSFNDVDQATFQFSVPNPSEDTSIKVFTTTFFDDSKFDDSKEEPIVRKKEAELKKCVSEGSSSSSSTSTTEAPSGTGSPTTAAPSTSEVEQPKQKLPDTGASAVPMLIAALVMVIGGGVAVYATRIRGRHVK